MKIGLINTPIRLRDKPRTLPIGLGIIASVLRNKGHEIVFIDLNAKRDLLHDINKVLDMLEETEIIGISGLITTYSFQKNLINEIKNRFPNKFIIAGGGLATSVPDLVFEKTKVDAVCIGEGEETSSALVESIETNRSIENIEGLWVRSSESIIKNKRRELIKQIDELPFPAYDLMDMETYLSAETWAKGEGRSASVITSRGCPFACTYCYHIFGRSTIRFRSAENIQQEIIHLKNNYQIDYAAFIDDNTTVNKRRLVQICDVMKEENVKWGCHGRADSASLETFELMKSSGCTFIGMGIESGSSKILKNINKHVTKKQAANALKWQRKVGFRGNSWIFGAPGENLRTIIETAIFCGRNKVLLYPMFTMTAYPGTPLFENALKEGKIQGLEEHVLKLDGQDAMRFITNFTDFPDKFLPFAKFLQYALAFLFFFTFHPFTCTKKVIVRVSDKLMKEWRG